MAISGFDLELLGNTTYDVSYMSSLQEASSFSGNPATGVTFNGDGWPNISNLQIGGWDGLLEAYPNVASIQFSDIDATLGTMTVNFLDVNGNPVTTYPFNGNGIQMQVIGFAGAGANNSSAFMLQCTDNNPPPFTSAQSFIFTSEPITPANGQFTGITFIEDAAAAGYVAPAPCFAAGTALHTADGKVNVEDLRVGDSVLTVSGVTRAITWIGHTRVHVRNHPRAWEVQPIRIRAHAFGEQLPVRDLVVSPGHAIYVDGVLIPAGCLVNGATIVPHDVDTVDYYHVELESHDVLIAEGLPCESYLDDGNRSSFANAREHVALHGRLDPQSWENAYAPCVMAGPQLAEVKQRLLDRALRMGFEMTEATDLHLVIDGQSVRPTMEAGQRAWFAIPAGAADVRIVSNAGVLAQLVPSLEDGRRLGVCVADVRLNGETVPMASDAFGVGFYGCETQGGTPWRWTDGNAQLSLPVMTAPAMLELAVVMRMKSWVAAPVLAMVKAMVKAA